MTTVRQKNQDDDMPWPPDNFTGEWIVEWPNGAIKFRSLYLGGKAEGKYECFWDNGNLAQIGYSEDDVCVGIWSDFWEDGTKFKETHYFGKRTFKTVWLDPDGVITETVYTVDYVDVSEAEFLRATHGAEQRGGTVR